MDKRPLDLPQKIHSTNYQANEYPQLQTPVFETMTSPYHQVYSIPSVSYDLYNNMDYSYNAQAQNYGSPMSYGSSQSYSGQNSANYGQYNNMGSYGNNSYINGYASSYPSMNEHSYLNSSNPSYTTSMNSPSYQNQGYIPTNYSTATNTPVYNQGYQTPVNGRQNKNMVIEKVQDRKVIPKRNTMAKEVKKILYTQFKLSPKLTPQILKALMSKTNLTDTQVKNWFTKKANQKGVSIKPVKSYKALTAMCRAPNGGVEMSKLDIFKTLVINSVSGSRKINVLKMLNHSDEQTIRKFALEHNGFVTLNNWLTGSIAMKELPNFIIPTLVVLNKFPISETILKQTGVGKTVTKYSKLESNQSVSRNAALLVQKWREDVKSKKRRREGTINSLPSQKKVVKKSKPKKLKKSVEISRSEKLKILDNAIESIEKDFIAKKRKTMKKKEMKEIIKIDLNEEEGKTIRWAEQLSLMSTYKQGTTPNKTRRTYSTRERDHRDNVRLYEWRSTLNGAKSGEWRVPNKLMKPSKSTGRDSTLKIQMGEVTIEPSCEVIQIQEKYNRYHVFPDNSVPSFPALKIVKEFPMLEVSALQQLLKTLAGALPPGGLIPQPQIRPNTYNNPAICANFFSPKGCSLKTCTFLHDKPQTFM